MWNNSVDHGGAGFMTSPGMGESATQGDHGKAGRSQSLVSVTAAQIMKGIQQDDSVKIGLEAVKMVTVVGLITAVDMQSTVVSFQLDDFTGPLLTVKQWLDQGGDAAEMRKPLVENCYVKVHCSMRLTNNEVYLVAHHVRSLTDLNELTHHLLDVVHTKLILERGFASSMRSAPGSMFGTRSYTGNGSMSATGGYSFGGDVVMNGLTPQQQQVFQTIRSFLDENGCSVDYLISNVRGMSADAVRKVVSFLSEEGHIYSTVDDDHFKATDN